MFYTSLYKLTDDDIELQFDDQFGCCGICVIHDLEQFFIAQVKQEEGKFVKYLKAKTNRKIDKVGMYVCSVNQEMYKVWEPILTKSGFTELSSAVNGKTSNRIYLFNKVIRKPRKSNRKASRCAG